MYRLNSYMGMAENEYHYAKAGMEELEACIKMREERRKAAGMKGVGRVE